MARRKRETLFAPWTDEQVEALNEYQQVAPMHPFTCARRDRGHGDHGERDVGILVATNDGWICRDCDYTQNWAHPFMADTSWWKKETQ